MARSGQSDRLRVLVVGARWPAETFLERLLFGLLDSDLEVSLRLRLNPGPGWLDHPNAGWFAANGSRRLAASVAEDRWDVIYFPWNSAAVDNLALLQSRVPCVISCRGSQITIAPHNPERADFRRALSETLRLATLVHCVSRHIMDEAGLYGLEERKARIIRPAVDTNVFRPTGRTGLESPFVLVTTGSLIWRKGLEYALLTLSELVRRGRDVRLDIIGNGPERDRVLYTAADLGVASHVRLLGTLTPEQVIERLGQSHVFLLSSLAEGISNAVLEAMSCAIPVVTTDVGGMKEAVRDGVEGYVVPVRDSLAAAERILQYMDDVDLMNRHGAAARSRVVDAFRLERQVAEFGHLLRDAAKTSS